METLRDIWNGSGRKKGLKVRFRDWNWKHRYFTVLDVSQCNEYLVGRLDCGEAISFPLSGLNWEVYYEGAEYTPQAV